MVPPLIIRVMEALIFLGVPLALLLGLVNCIVLWYHGKAIDALNARQDHKGE